LTPGCDAQVGDLPVAGGVGPGLAEAERHPGVFGQQVSPPGCSLGQFGDRGGLLGGGELPALSVARGGSGDLRGEDTVGVWISHTSTIELVFDLRQGLGGWLRRP
jgi:hypothetical protein